MCASGKKKRQLGQEVYEQRRSNTCTHAHYLKVLGRDAVGKQEEKLAFQLFQLLFAQQLQNLLELVHEQHLWECVRVTN